MRAALADCTYVEIPGSDHLVYADNPTAFYAAFDAWLAGLEARGVLAGR
jgi:pimeloyl-ACP methyl ester carboxylesterase